MSNTTTLGTDSALRKQTPLHRGALRYFPAALAWVSRISQVGNDKHNSGEEMHHARGKSADHSDCLLRHLVDMDEDMGHGKGYDEQGRPQVAYIAWRALALAQEWLEANGGAPLAPGARLPVVKKSEAERAVDAEAHNSFHADDRLNASWADDLRATWAEDIYRKRRAK